MPIVTPPVVAAATTTLTDYAGLQASIANFLHRSDLNSIIVDFIKLAEVRINGDLDARSQDTKTTLSTSIAQETVGLPTDCINIRHLSVSSVTPVITLDYVSPDQFETVYPWGNNGIPQVYSVIGGDIYLAPKPDAVYSLDLVYKAKVPNLSTNLTTWLMTNYPNVYLYGALCESAPYLKDDNRIPVWEMKYKEAIQSVNNQDWYSGSTMRVRGDVRM